MRNKEKYTSSPTEGRAGPQRCWLIRLQQRGTWWLRTLDFNTPWVQNHIAGCPRCQRRFVHLGRIKLALTLAKSQRHGNDLLARANTQAFKVLRRPLRQTPQAKNLKIARPAPHWRDRLYTMRGTFGQMAACVTLLVLGKIGLLGSLQGAQTRTEKAVHSYYTQRLGQPMAEEVFPGQG
ncbi:hypothetical protein ACFL6U_29740 [Planctomycetota bacterium]